VTTTVNRTRGRPVLIRVVAAGLCHTDPVARDQVYPVPRPNVLGHEGAGIVEAVGPAVQKVAPR
jgi:aryl-alcohol dehydrogenase